MSYTMREITRRSKLRALKAYGLRCAGLKYREIAKRIGRRDHGLFSNLDFRDKPITDQAVARIVNKGARIVIMWHNRRRRQYPVIAMRFCSAR